jgi:hypothetical protein
MRIRITDIYKKDCHRDHRKSLIGSTGDLIMSEHHWRGWYWLDVINQSYVDVKDHDGYGIEGDSTFYAYAKFEILEEE